MENKTISYLNSKIWYRFLKVIYIGLILLCVIILTALAMEFYKPHNVQDYRIDCKADYTNKKSFLAEKEAGIYIYKYSNETIYQSLSSETKLKIRNLCDISETEASLANEKAMSFVQEQRKIGTDESIIQKNIDDNMRPYSIEESNIIEGSYAEVVIRALLYIIILFLLFEFFRRIFYYIILGTMRPKK